MDSLTKIFFSVHMACFALLKSCRQIWAYSLIYSLVFYYLVYVVIFFCVKSCFVILPRTHILLTKL